MDIGVFCYIVVAYTICFFISRSWIILVVTGAHYEEATIPGEDQPYDLIGQWCSEF
jgi:hypothetical protein